MSKVENIGPLYDGRKIGVVFDLPADQDPVAAKHHLQVLADSFSIYLERNYKYKDNWRKMGWKGAIVRIKERTDRIWDNIWPKQPGELKNQDLGDVRDLINFAAFLIRGIEYHETTRNGDWFWDK